MTGMGMGGEHAEERERAGRPVTSREAVPGRCANLICLIPVHCSGRRPRQPMPAWILPLARSARSAAHDKCSAGTDALEH